MNAKLAIELGHWMFGARYQVITNYRGNPGVRVHSLVLCVFPCVVFYISW